MGNRKRPERPCCRLRFPIPDSPFPVLSPPIPNISTELLSRRLRRRRASWCPCGYPRDVGAWRAGRGAILRGKSMSFVPERKSSSPALEALRVPPHSIDAEQAVLGGLMLAPGALDNVADRLGE